MPLYPHSRRAFNALAMRALLPVALLACTQCDKAKTPQAKFLSARAALALPDVQASAPPAMAELVLIKDTLYLHAPALTPADAASAARKELAATHGVDAASTHWPLGSLATKEGSTQAASALKKMHGYLQALAKAGVLDGEGIALVANASRPAAEVLPALKLARGAGLKGLQLSSAKGSVPTASQRLCEESPAQQPLISNRCEFCAQLMGSESADELECLVPVVHMQDAGAFLWLMTSSPGEDACVSVPTPLDIAPGNKPALSPHNALALADAKTCPASSSRNMEQVLELIGALADGLEAPLCASARLIPEAGTWEEAVRAQRALLESARFDEVGFGSEWTASSKACAGAFVLSPGS